MKLTKHMNIYIFVLTIVLYMGVLTLYGEYIVSRPMNVWLQAFFGVLVLMYTIFQIKLVIDYLKARL